MWRRSLSMHQGMGKLGDTIETRLGTSAGRRGLGAVIALLVIAGTITAATADSDRSADVVATRPHQSTTVSPTTAVPIETTTTVEAIATTVPAPPTTVVADRRRAAAPPPKKAGAPAAPQQVTGAGLYVVRSDGSGIMRVSTNASGHPSWSPDGKRVAYVCEHFALCVAMSDGASARTIPDTGEVFAVRWSPDGTRLAYYNSDEVKTVPTDGSSPPTVVARTYASPPDWAPDGRLAYIQRGHTATGDLTIVERDGSKRVVVPDAAGAVAWSPDGTRLAYASGKSSLRVVGADGSNPHEVATLSRLGQTASWSADGSSIVYLNRAEVRVVRWDGSGNRLVTAAAADPSTSRTEPLVAYVGSGDWDLRLVGIDGGAPRLVAPVPVGFRARASDWSRDGRIAFVVVTDGESE